MIAALVVACVPSGAGGGVESAKGSLAGTPARRQGSAAPAPDPPGGTRPQEFERRLGPFSLGPFAIPLRRTFTVVLHGKRLPGGRGSDSEALTSWEIRDADGTVQHREELADEVAPGNFPETCSASAELLTGSVAVGLLVSVGCVPSAPDSGDIWEIFGIVNGRLVRFGKPFTTIGQLIRLVPTPVARRGSAVMIQPDTLEFRVWTGNFHVTVPVRVDWMQGRLMQGMHCLEPAGPGVREGGCDLPVEAERIPGDEEMSFVRLFIEPTEGMGVPRHVVLRKNSVVEILSARVKLSWDDSRELILFGVDDRDPWLKVRIDGKEGWIHTQEDFQALGVPEAG